MVAFIQTETLVKFIREGIKESRDQLAIETDPDKRLALRSEISQLRKQLKEARDL